MNNLLAFSFTFLFSMALVAQPKFSNQAGLLSAGNTYSGVAMAVVDMNNDGLDDIIRVNNGNNIIIEFQAPGGLFDSYIAPQQLNNRTWGITVADVDLNGSMDIAVGGVGNSTEIWFGNDPLDPFGYTRFSLSEVNFLQGANFADINNDGLLDYFACDDVDISKPYTYSGNMSMSLAMNLISPVSTVPSDNSGNYASIWTDYDDDGDLDMYLSKCRQGVGNPMDGRRLNQLFQNEGGSGFVDVAEDVGLLPFSQSWSTDFADIDNDGDMDCFVVNHDNSSALYLNDGNNNYSDVTAAFGMVNSLPVGPFGIQCNFEDFNNDGWIDLLLTHNQGIPIIIFQNDGGNSMTPFIGDELMASGGNASPQSVATGDLNNDGYIDFYGGYASGFNSPSNTDPDVLMINNLSGNNHLKFRLTGTFSNSNAIGAKIKVYDADFGVQVREVRSGEGYGIMNSLTQHFGLGATAAVDSVVIRWPSGLTERAFNVFANQTLEVEEGAFDQSLPLEWESFTAVPNGKKVQLDWTTSQEEGTSHFIVERSVDLTNWSEVGREMARNEALSQAYRRFDALPFSGTSYYRLRQVDLDGVFTFSPIETVSFTTTGFSVFPNPAGDWINVRNEDSNAHYTIESIDGRVIRKAAPATSDRLSLEKLNPGVYLIRSGGEVRRIVRR